MESVLRTSTHTTPVEVRSVWASNLDREFRVISQAIKGAYHQVAFDTEFKLAPEKKNVVKTHPRFVSPDERYCAIKESTDKGNLRQLGLTLSADDGSVLVWEFNFSPFHHLANMEENFEAMGDYINSYFFSELLSSGLLNNPRMTWIMFHGSYDLVFLIKLATFWSPLPDTLVEFQSVVHNCLGDSIYDVKYMTKFTNNLYGGLKEVSTTLCVKRVVGQAHQAGSDSLLTWHTYEKLKKVYFPHDSGIRHAGFLYAIHDI
jgi:CCR4-NOT transcription complex subunit 7/8